MRTRTGNQAKGITRVLAMALALSMVFTSISYAGSPNTADPTKGAAASTAQAQERELDSLLREAVSQNRAPRLFLNNPKVGFTAKDQSAAVSAIYSVELEEELYAACHAAYTVLTSLPTLSTELDSLNDTYKDIVKWESDDSARLEIGEPTVQIAEGSFEGEGERRLIFVSTATLTWRGSEPGEVSYHVSAAEADAGEDPARADGSATFQNPADVENWGGGGRI